MMVCRENLIIPRGHFSMDIKRHGKIIEHYEDHNLIVNDAKLLLAHLIAGDTAGNSIVKVGFGTNGVPPTPDDTALTDVFLKNVKSVFYPGFSTEELNLAPLYGLPNDLVVDNWLGYRVQFNWELLTTEDNGQAICEFGLVSGNNVLFNRKARNNPIYKANDISIEGSWIVVF